MTMGSLYSNGLRNHKPAVTVATSCQYGPKSLINVSSIMKNKGTSEGKRVQPTTSKVYLTKWPESVYWLYLPHYNILYIEKPTLK